MIRLVRAPNAAIATIWADLLCEAGYPAVVQRLYLCAAAGELPPDQCLPEVWIRHVEHLCSATRLLDDLRALPQRHWACPACGEDVEGGFEECWRCGAPMPR